MRRFRIELASVVAALALSFVFVLASGRTSPAADAGSTDKPATAHTATPGTLQPSSAESTPANTPATTSETTPAKTTKAKRHRGDHLPLYYKGLVTDDQKEQLYSIQDDYRPKLKALKDQLKALTAERDAKLDALLTADQKAKVQAKRDEAQAKRADAEGKRADKKASRGKNAKHIATPSTEAPVEKPAAEKPADQAPSK
jgi:cell division protein ZapA (FtsZ GTPase activity inhibitor)